MCENHTSRCKNNAVLASSKFLSLPEIFTISIFPLTKPFIPFFVQFINFLALSYQKKSELSCLVLDGSAKNFKGC